MIESLRSLPFGAIRVRLFSAGTSSVRLFRGLLTVYIFMLVLLPSGSICGFNIKFLWFFLLFPVALHIYFNRGRSTLPGVLLMLAIPAGLLAWFLLSQFNGFDPEYALAHYKDLMVTICSCWFVALLCAEGIVESVFVLRQTVLAEVVASVFKITLLGYAIARGVPVTEVIEWIKSVFGISLMTIDFGSMLGRIQFISDGLIPICIFAILSFRKILKFRAATAIAMLMFLLISDFFAFSRYFWAFTVLAVALGLLLGDKDRFRLVFLPILAGLALLCLPILTSVVTLRFSSAIVDSSDVDRTQQVAALDDFWASAPLFGHGLGSYTRRVIRNDDAPYSYEDQLLALAGQVGIIGILILGSLGLYYFRALVPSHRSGTLRSLALAAMLLAWIGAGLVNPEVISSAASVSYAALFAMTKLLEATATRST